MKEFLQKILSQTRYKVILAILLIIVIGSNIYLYSGITKNIQEMADAASDTPDYFPDYPVVDTTGKDPALVKRGEYLAKAGDCIACHTNSPEKGQRFAGGLPMRTPFGVIYSPNITPDKETGIGKWTETQFINAMNKGISPQGHYYYPAFPYLYFSKVTEDDLKALKAYFDSIPAIKQPNRANEMVKPFNARALQFGWRLLFFRHNTGVFQADAKQSAEWNRGAYLVEGLGHCSMCHSPSYQIFSDKLPLGAPIRKYDLSGAKIQGYLAPNITKTNLDNVSEEEIVKVFTEDRMIGGGKVDGPMLEVNHDSLRHLSRSDLFAIATYLKAVQTKSPPKPKPGKGGPGRGIYETYCSGCHAAGAGGAPKYGDPAAWEALLKPGIATIYTHAIKGVGGMPAKGTCLSCSDTEIKQAVDFMLASVTGKAARPIAPPVKKLTMEDGKHIYDTSCSVCHATGFKNAPKLGDQKAWQPMVKAGFIHTLEQVIHGYKDHPPRGACTECSDAELKAATKYMMQQSTTQEDYSLW